MSYSNASKPEVSPPLTASLATHRSLAKLTQGLAHSVSAHLSLVETIIEYNDGEGYRMELSDYSFPLKYMFSDISVIPLSETYCEITMSTDFLVKAGPLGWLLGHFVMRPIMKGAFEKVMSGLACYTASGEIIGDTLPTDNTLERLTAA